MISARNFCSPRFYLFWKTAEVAARGWRNGHEKREQWRGKVGGDCGYCASNCGNQAKRQDNTVFPSLSSNRVSGRCVEFVVEVFRDCGSISSAGSITCDLGDDVLPVF
jgi:hypothetical protein